MMRFSTPLRLFAMCSLCVMLTACIGSGPGKALHETAGCLERKDSAAFLAKIDTVRYAAAVLDNMTQNNPALSAIDGMAGKLLGMGVADMINSVAPLEKRLVEDFRQGVATGSLVNECSSAASTDCPWTPASLRGAKIRQLGSAAAVAHVTMPGNVATFLAMAKVGEEWKIVGLSPREDFAERYAATPVKPAPASPAAPSAQNKGTSI